MSRPHFHYPFHWSTYERITTILEKGLQPTPGDAEGRRSGI